MSEWTLRGTTSAMRFLARVALIVVLRGIRDQPRLFDRL